RGEVDLALCHSRALVCLQLNDRAGFRAVCARLRSVVRRGVPWEDGLAAAEVYTLGPAEEEDRNLLRDLAGRLARTANARAGGKPATEVVTLRRALVRGAARLLHRAGDHREALGCLSMILRDGDKLTVPDALVVALARRALGAGRDARALLGHCKRAMDA